MTMERQTDISQTSSACEKESQTTSSSIAKTAEKPPVPLRRPARRPTMKPNSSTAREAAVPSSIPQKSTQATESPATNPRSEEWGAAKTREVPHITAVAPLKTESKPIDLPDSTSKMPEKPRETEAAKNDATAKAKNDVSQNGATKSDSTAVSEKHLSHKKKRKKGYGHTILRVVLRTLLVIVTLIILLVVGLCMVCNLVFNGPSETARDILTMSMVESSGMKWVPGLFIGEETVEQIKEKVSAELPAEQSDPSQILITKGTISGSASDEWKDAPDGVRIETVSGDTYNAYVMLIRDPSQVYLATSSDRYSKDIPGTRINKQIVTEGAIAAINAGAFFDNGTSSSVVGSVPCGLVIADGKVMWDDGDSYYGFAGFNTDNVLVVAKTMTASQAKSMNIRDGCCFGPVLIMNGTVNEEAYNTNSGYNPRTAIGQRADGTVIFLCVDGRQAGSLGASYADIIDIMVEYGAVNACNLDGGSSTVMLYKDTYGRYGEEGQIQMINNYSLLQEEPRRMPTFFMVRPAASKD